MSAEINICIATSNGYFFADTTSDDVAIYTGLPSQRILMGCSNSLSRIVVTSNLVYTNSNLGVMKSNPSYALDVLGDVNFSGSFRQAGIALIGSQWSNSNTQVFILSSNVGIGTSNPNSRLGVDGNMILRNSTDTWQTVCTFQGNNTSNSFLMNAGGTGNNFMGTNAFGVYDNSASINSFVTVWKGGNMGIGTTTPASGIKLDVNGIISAKTTAGAALVICNSNNASQCAIAIAASAGQTSTSALSNDLIIRADNPTSRVHIQNGSAAAGLTINSNNYVGIRTNTPLYPLHVNTNTKTPMILGSNCPVCMVANDPIIGFNMCYVSNWQTPQYSSSGYSGRLTFLSASGAFNFASTNVAVGANSNLVSGVQVHMTISNTGFVGIGCNIPSFVLDVKGNTPNNTLAQFSSCNIALIVSTGDITARYNGLTKAGDVVLASTSNYTTDSAGLVLGPWTTGSKGIRIDSNGNVGIGFNTPMARLHVNGAAWANNLLAMVDGTSNAPAFSWSNDTNTGMLHPAVNRFSLSVAGSNMVFMTSSNIGIGTLTPSNTLDVVGTVSASTFYCQSNLGVGFPAAGWYGGIGDRVILGSGNTGVYPYSIGMIEGTMWQSVPSGAQHQWYINGVVGMTFSNYMLGIGVSNPSFALDVKGSNVNSYNIAQFESTCNTALMVTYGDVATRYSGMVTQGDIALIVSSNSQQSTSGLVMGPWTSVGIHKGIRIDGPTGYVGVGVSNPATQLHVSGDASVNTLVASNAQVAGSYIPNFASNLLAYYPFDGNANDASSNFHLSAAGYVSYRNVGKVNNAITFNNPMISTTLETIYVENTTIASTITGPPITVACWFNLGSNVVTNTQPTMFMLGCNMNTPYIRTNINIGNALIVATMTSNSGGLQSLSTGSTITSNVWYHLGITYDNTNIITYLNGSQINSTAITGNFMNTAASRLRIGGGVGWTSSNGYGFYGAIDDFRVYNRVLSATEISTLYQSNMATSMIAFGSNTNTKNFVGVCMPNPQQALDIAGNIQCTGNISAGNLGVFRNRIINGDMRIAQRGTSSNVGTGTLSGFTCLDRWASYSTISTGGMSIAQQNLTSNDAPYQYGLQNSMRYTATANNSYGTIQPYQPIEGTMMSDLNWGTPYGTDATISMWIKTNASAGSVISVAIRKSGASYVSPVTMLGSNTWQNIAFTVPPPPKTGAWNIDSNLWAILFIGPFETASKTSTYNSWINGNYTTATSSTNIFGTLNNYVEFTGVQLEKGPIATPFELRSYDFELALCQRYYEVITTVGSTYAMNYYYAGSNAANLRFQFRQQKRAIPSLASGSIVGANATLSNMCTIDAVNIQATIITTGGFYFNITPPVAFVAEL